MSEQPIPSPPPQQQPHAKTLRENAIRRLSRSPHPYHHQQSQLPHSSERFSASTPPPQSSLRSAHTTDDERPQASRRSSGAYRDSTGSDSGTEADDEHFLKGLPAPKLRSHKGLRGAEGSLSNSPSPRLSPAADDTYTSPGVFRRSTLPVELLTEEEGRKAAEKFAQKRRVEVVRRTTEAGLLVFLGGVICLDPNVRRMLWFWKRGKYYGITLVGIANGNRTCMPVFCDHHTSCVLSSPFATAQQSFQHMAETTFYRHTSGF